MAEEPEYRELMRDVFEENYGYRSICNNWELDAIWYYANSNVEILMFMKEREGNPSPRRKVKYEDLPQSLIIAPVSLQEQPDLEDEVAMEKWLASKYKLGSDAAIDIFLVKNWIREMRETAQST